MSMYSTSSGHGDVLHEMIRRRSAVPGSLLKPSRPAVVVGVALAGLLNSGVSVAGSGVPVSIEGGEFRLGGEVSTEVISDSPEKRVEVGTTADGIPVTITRLSYQKMPLPRDDEGGREKDSGDGTQVQPDNAGVPVEASASDQTRTKALVDTSEDALSPFMIHAVTPTSVSLAWDSDPSTVYHIVRDGQPIAQVSGGAYVDETVSPGNAYQYVIEPVGIPGQGNEFQRVMSTTFNIRTPAEGPASGVSSGKSRRTLKRELADGPTRTIYVRRTFIPDATVRTSPFQNPGCDSAVNQEVVYTGDDRSWDNTITLDEGKSRTEVRLYMDWSRPSDGIDASIHVSRTHRTVDGKDEERQARANAGLFRREYVNRRGTYARMEISHDIGNPFCSFGSIRYQERIQMWNDGMVTVSGWRRKAPAHEAVVGLVKGAGKLMGTGVMFQRENEGFRCLVRGSCRIDDYSSTYSP